MRRLVGTGMPLPGHSCPKLPRARPPFWYYTQYRPKVALAHASIRNGQAANGKIINPNCSSFVFYNETASTGVGRQSGEDYLPSIGGLPMLRYLRFALPAVFAVAVGMPVHADGKNNASDKSTCGDYGTQVHFEKTPS